ncbi:MAG: hypothetical protein ACUVQM_00505 [Candidatus Hadarchaeaceae archaeon]
MKEDGFVPFSAAGAIMLVIIIAMVAQAEFVRHHESLNIVSDYSLSFLLTTAAEMHNNLKLITKNAVYHALWTVCKKASDFPENRLQEIELRATRYFLTAISEFEFSKHDARIELTVAEEVEDPLIKISEGEEGFVRAKVSLPEGSRIKITSWDGRARISIPFENVDVLVDSRYFLLERKMEEFIKKKGKILGLWTALEYSWVLADLILVNKVELDGIKTKKTFEAAWSIQELETFGSTDYLAMKATNVQVDYGPLKKPVDKIITFRENTYELLPPVPLKKLPGISVYHNLDVKKVVYQRQDPAGLLGLPSATPIPLGTSGATVWWGQWKITIEIEEEPIEEIFDFDNPTIPHIYGGLCTHLALAYRWRFSEKKFTTILSIVSPKPFLIFAR